MRGMILAAGLGTRLFPLTLFRAKPAVPFLNRPLIGYSLELLRRACVDKVVINLHHLPESIMDAVRTTEDSAQVEFSHEDVILGTAGGIGKVRQFLAGSETFVVCNGKIYFEDDLRDALDFHRQSGAMATLVLVHHPAADGFHPVFMDESNNMTGFGGPESRNESHQGYTFTGVHILSREILRFIPAGVSDTVRDLYPELMRQGFPVKGFVSPAYWCECSSRRRYLERSLDVMRRRGRDNLIESEAVQARCRGVMAGPLVEADKSCLLEHCVLWDNVRVGRNSSLRNVILSSGVILPPETHLQDAVVTPLPEKPAPEVTAAGWIRENCLVWPL